MTIIAVDFVEFKLAAEWKVTLLACGIFFIYQADQNIDR